MNKNLKICMAFFIVLNFLVFYKFAYASSLDNVKFVSASNNESILSAVESLEDFNEANIQNNVEQFATENEIFSNASNNEVKIVNYILSKNPNISKSVAQQIYTSANKNSKKYGVNIYLILAMIECESTFDPNCVGSSVHGLLQIHENTAPYLGLSMDKIYDVDSNIGAGVSYLSKYITKYSDTKTALTCYSHGEGSYLSGRYSYSYANKVISRANSIENICS